jgi:hypothetical protein
MFTSGSSSADTMAAVLTTTEEKPILLHLRAFRASRLVTYALALLVLTLAAATFGPGRASAALYAQQEGWGEFGEGQGKLFDSAFMGVDSTDGSVYVASFTGDFSKLLIQKFSKTGTFEGVASLPYSFPSVGFAGIAVDHAAGHFYVLESAEGADGRRSGAYVATKLLEFSTNPTAGKLEQKAELPVPPTGEAKTLFEPREIAVDPSNSDIVVLAQNSDSKTVLQRIVTTGSGSVGSEYVENGSSIKPIFVGMALSPAGTTYLVTGAQREQVKAYSLPENYSGATLSPVPGFEAAGTAEGWPLEEPTMGLLNFGVAWGPQVALTTGAGGETTLYWKSAALLGDLTHPGDYVIHGYSLQSQATSVAYGHGPAEGSCKIETRSAALAPSEGGTLVVLDQGEEVSTPTATPTWFPAVYRFGSGANLGQHSAACPAPAAAMTLKDEAGAEIPSGGSVVEGARVVLDPSGSEAKSQTLESTTWSIVGPGGTSTLHGGTLAHVFTTPGQYTVSLVMKTSPFSAIGNTFSAARKLTVTAGGGLTRFGLSLSASGHGTGTFECDPGSGFGPCAAEYVKGEEVVIKAVPSSGSEVIGWSGPCDAVAGDLCTISNMNSPRTIAAVIGKEVAFNLSSSGTGTGRIQCAVGSGAAGTCVNKYPEGETVTVTATASPGSAFSGWSGDCTGTGACQVTMTAPHSIGAVFTLTTNSGEPGGGGGTGTGTGGGGGGSSNSGGGSQSGGGSSPGGGGGTKGGPSNQTKTKAQRLAEQRSKARAKCKKLKGKQKSICLKHANAIGKPKPKHKKK